MKRLWGLLLVVGLALWTPQAPASGSARDQDYYPIVDTSEDSPNTIIESPNDGFSIEVYHGKATITGYDGSERQISVPESIEGIPVVSISEDAFRGCGGITELTVPESVTAIERGAFDGCGRNFTLLTTKDSYAEQYAKENGVPYETVVEPDGSSGYWMQTFQGEVEYGFNDEYVEDPEWFYNVDCTRGNSYFLTYAKRGEDPDSEFYDRIVNHGHWYGLDRVLKPGIIYLTGHLKSVYLGDYFWYHTHRIRVYVGDSFQAEIVEDGQSFPDIPTFYFRKSLSLPGGEPGEELTVRLIVDYSVGYVVYIAKYTYAPRIIEIHLPPCENFLDYASGFHTALVRSDGTVAATGYNAFGQCNTGDWTGM